MYNKREGGVGGGGCCALKGSARVNWNRQDCSVLYQSIILTVIHHCYYL